MADETSILATREQLVSDLYRQAASMLAGKGKKRKLGSDEEGEVAEDEPGNPLSKWIADSGSDPLTAATEEQDQVEADQNAVLGSDPVIGEVSQIKMPKSGGGAGWKRRIYAASRAAQKQPFTATGNDVNAVATALWQQAKGAAGSK